MYTFKTVYTADGGKTWTSGTKTLDVGCTNAVFTENTGLVMSSVVYIGASTSNVYTFSNPTVDLAYCSVVINNLVNVKLDGTLDASQAFFPSGCTQPCTGLDILSTSSIGKIEFNVQSVIPGNFVDVSTRITINLEC